ncbi:ABC transporter substrate-binding protein [Paraburkholderia sp. IW21]|jgi:NitT/TauT family transport system substrate-binding protein|uniref:ABC transporter substrate-binding protein n=1 Tax=Paraburkholderia sp. IW21 TaxID=3242488 RepID=UPI003520E6BE
MRHLIRKSKIFACLLILCGLTGVANSADTVAPKYTLTIAISGETLVYFPLYVARAGGFFEREGIKVDWVNVGAASRQTPAVMGGSADVTPLSLFHMFDAESKGLKLVAISDLFDATALQVVLTNKALKSTGITASMSLDEKIKRLKGLQIGTSAPGSGTETAFRKMLIARGIDPDKWVQLRPVGGAAPSLAAFQNGLIDGVVYAAPVPEIIESKGLGRTVIDGFTGEVPEVAGVPFLVLATSRDTIQKKGPMINAAVAAIAKAMAFTQQHPEETSAMLRQYFQNTDPAVYAKMADSYRKASARSPLITPQQVANTARWTGIGETHPVDAKYLDIVDPEPARLALGQTSAKQGQ